MNCASTGSATGNVIIEPCRNAVGSTGSLTENDVIKSVRNAVIEPVEMTDASTTENEE